MCVSFAVGVTAAAEKFWRLPFMGLVYTKLVAPSRGGGCGWLLHTSLDAQDAAGLADASLSAGTSRDGLEEKNPTSENMADDVAVAVAVAPSLL